MAFVFGSTADDELYPFLTDDGSDVPLSPDEQALLMGMYPGANLTDFDFSLIGPNGVVQQHHASASHTAADAAAAGAAVLTAPHNSVSPTSIRKIPTPTDVTMDITADANRANGRNKMPGLEQPAYYDPALYQQQQHQFNGGTYATSRRSDAHSPNAYSPSSSSLSDSGVRDSEDILRAPVKSLNEEEKKLRRRAQVAKSARKHRNRQKEELSRLREQVQFLQEQMALMHVQGTPTNGGGAIVANGNGMANANSTDIDMEKKGAIHEHRKRKKTEDSASRSSDATLETAVTNQPALAAAAQHMLQASARTMVATPTILHGYHHLPADTLERARMLLMISTKRAQSARQYLHSQFGNRVVQYPTMDIKLNSNGPDMEIQLVRAKKLPGFTHLEVADAAWNSVYDFNLAIPARFKRYVTCERLMELDENTRYGRTIAPLLKNREENFVVYMHSYFVVHKAVFDDCAIFTWESIFEDDLYPFEASDTAIRNDEVGCMILETETLPNGDVQSLQRTVIHSTPPIAAITEPRGRLNEAFLTVFCRNADILETSARLYLRDKYPERTIKSEFEYVNE